jgi:hypothetical protein
MKEMMLIKSDWTKVSDLEKCVNDHTVLGQVTQLMMKTCHWGGVTLTADNANTRSITGITVAFHFDLVVKLCIDVTKRWRGSSKWMRMVPTHQS